MPRRQRRGLGGFSDPEVTAGRLDEGTRTRVCPEARTRAALKAAEKGFGLRDETKMNNRFTGEANVPLESVLVFMAGVMLLITGALLFPVSSGRLDYYENGLYGLLLVMFALQIITMGKTPFGEARRSVPVLVGGGLVAAIGTGTCFVPDLYAWLPRILLSVFFGFGGLIQLLRMLFEEDKYRAWKGYGRPFNHLITACAMVYALEMALVAPILRGSLLSVGWTAALVLALGVSLVYLAVVIWKIHYMYVGEAALEAPAVTLNLSTDNALIMLVAMYMFVLGILLLPVNKGLLPFSGSAQLGLLMFLFSIQMLAFGGTPLGPFRRSWLMMLAGLLFASLGIVSCIIPELLVTLLTYLVGVLNLLGGAVGLVRVALFFLGRPGHSREPHSPTLKMLGAAQLVTNSLTILFGVAMLISGLFSGIVLGVILGTNGAVLFYVFYLLVVLDNPGLKGVGDVQVP